MVVSLLLEEFLDGFPSPFLAQEKEGEGEEEAEAQPGGLLLFSQLPFLLTSF